MNPGKVLKGFIKAMVLTSMLSMAVATIDAASSIKPGLTDDISQLVGNWTGEPICKVKKDEK